MGFFHQLIVYEERIRGKRSSTLVQVNNPQAKDFAINVPDFYLTEYPKLVEAELTRQNSKPK